MAFLAPMVVVMVVVVAAAAIATFPLQLAAQQSYVNNKQLNCNLSPNNTLGFVCNAAASCPSFLTFRSTPTYNSPATIAYLLAADATQIAAANNVSDVALLPTDTLVIVPVNCSCSGHFYQHNASYALKIEGETYFSVANDTYQSLSTCQALIAQNPYNPIRLLPGMKLTVPLRCACPTPAQAAAGFRYLLTYLVRQGNDFSSIAAEFAAAGADIPGILAANTLSDEDTVFFFTPLLVPLRIPPTKENINTAASPPLPPASPALPTTPAGGGSRKWVFIGVGIGAAVLVILFSIALIWLFRRKPHHRPLPEEAIPPLPPLHKGSDLSEGIRSAMESLTIYTLEELEKATNNFSESNRMDGSSSVYLGLFNGDEAAVKVVKGDVTREIDALRQMKHSRIVSLSGFCLHQGTTYLVYEYAEGGSLHQWLHRPSAAAATIKEEAAPKANNAGWLDWKQRVQIAYDVADALYYLHNFTNPPYIHKNLTTANILLDAAMRAKVANFGLARATSSDATTTRHVVGAQGYMAPEYIEAGLLTPKLDVFALGVVMLELLSGRDAIDLDHDPVLLYQSIGGGVLSGREKLQGFMDPNLKEEYPLELAYSMAQLAAACVALDHRKRPTVSEVFIALSALRSSSLDWDPSQDTSITFSE